MTESPDETDENRPDPFDHLPDDPDRDTDHGTETETRTGTEPGAGSDESPGETDSGADPEPDETGDPDLAPPAGDTTADQYPDWLVESQSERTASEGGAGSGVEDGARDSTDPFAGLDEPAGDPFDQELFESVETDAIDPDRAWASLEGDGPDDAEDSERTVTEVSKRRYCERCEYFSEPPDVGCTHGGTEILGFPDRETVRMVDCPIVAKRRELEQE